MLDTKRQPDRTFEEWMEEALERLPMYSPEWTNYNPSDPGITILENLIAFGVLQQSQMEETTPKVMEKLLKLAGIERRPGRCARVLLSLEGQGNMAKVPANQQFFVGETVFETERPWKMDGCRLTGVYGRNGKGLLDAGVLLNKEIPLSVRIFGESPREGDAVYFISDGLPKEGEIHFYIRTVKTPYRNAFIESVNNRFARISWQCYTKDGFKDIQCKDMTGAFLTDGELIFRGIKDAAVYEELPKQGFCIRGVLRKVDYDTAPQLLSVFGFLIEAVQKKTGCTVKGFPKRRIVEVDCNLLADGYFRVFCREGDGKSYRRYDPYDGLSDKGRYYELKQHGASRIALDFNRGRFGAGPARVKEAVRVVIYNEEMMSRYELGMVYGYDDQQIELPVKHIVPENFCLLAERRDDFGERYYDFVKPGKQEDGDLKYELLAAEGMIRITDAGDFIEARLFLAELSTYRGESGNVRENNRFVTELPSGPAVFTNPASGAGGRLAEPVSQAVKRLYEEMKRPETAVCAADYEEMVKKISGLCIQKVRAVMDDEKNEVLIIVKPWSEEEFPKLTPLYRTMLEKFFEPRRLLATRIRFAGPRYVGIDVRGVIYVKRHYERYREEIEAVLNRHLDYRKGEQNFGQVLRFEKLFYELESLECIASMQNLSVYPQNQKLASVEGMDIRPAKDCLCYPGNFYLDIHGGRL